MSRRQPRFDSFDALLDGRPAATLDLHGQTREEARAVLKRFLERERKAHSGQVVHVITGRGRGSAGKPVLKPMVKRLLAGELSPLVAEYDEDVDGGGWRVRLR
jgi:DNA-nicking Smr family endonuclease